MTKEEKEFTKEEKEFTTIYNKHYNELLYYIRDRYKFKCYVDDIMQEVWAVFWKKVFIDGDITTINNPIAFLKEIAKRKIMEVTSEKGKPKNKLRNATDSTDFSDFKKETADPDTILNYSTDEKDKNVIPEKHKDAIIDASNFLQINEFWIQLYNFMHEHKVTKKAILMQLNIEKRTLKYHFDAVEEYYKKNDAQRYTNVIHTTLNYNPTKK